MRNSYLFVTMYKNYLVNI